MLNFFNFMKSIQCVYIEMMERRKPTFVSGYPNNATVLSGGEAILECAVRGGTTALPPHIKWLKRIPYHEVINGNSVKNKHLIPVENQHVLVIQVNIWPLNCATLTCKLATIYH